MELLKLLVVLLQLLVGFRYPILGLEVSLLDQFGPEVLLGGERWIEQTQLLELSVKVLDSVFVLADICGMERYLPWWVRPVRKCPFHRSWCICSRSAGSRSAGLVWGRNNGPCQRGNTWIRCLSWMICSTRAAFLWLLVWSCFSKYLMFFYKMEILCKYMVSWSTVASGILKMPSS